jgi:hypothetical protein
MKTARLFALFVVASMLAACGGGGGSQEAEKPLDPFQVLIYGNAITTQGPDPSIGWNSWRGMAASDADHDYAHLVLKRHGRGPAFIQNYSQLETDPVGARSQISTWAAAVEPSLTVVVLQFGDEAPGHGASPEFTASFNALADAMSHGTMLACVSTWIEDKDKDAMMRAACESRGGFWVYIGDIYPRRADVIAPGEPAEIAWRPHDASMAEIADRVMRTIL